MRPEPKVREAEQLLGWLLDRAGPSPDRLALELAHATLAWVLEPRPGLASPLGEVLATIRALRADREPRRRRSARVT